MEASVEDISVGINGVPLTSSCNTLILPGYYGEIDSIGNILINPLERKPTAATTYTAVHFRDNTRTHYLNTLLANLVTIPQGCQFLFALDRREIGNPVGSSQD
jgi:hypothetical protein